MMHPLLWRHHPLHLMVARNRVLLASFRKLI
ncbi:MAG: hypothetical protein ACI90Q_001674, partial [Nonlabens sp.]